MERLSDVARSWGVTELERRIRFPCDGTLPNSNDALYYGITLDTSPAILFRWLCQMRVAGRRTLAHLDHDASPVVEPEASIRAWDP
jgi:hypothetical protein